ncbi:MAG: 6-bladed beta-propeller, partial [Tannerella sp.]|nr:6-bladed beta-propeller [Tannerella sp.]
NKTETGEAIETIFVSSINHQKKANFSELFDSVKFIPLETTDDVLISGITKIHAVENRFFIFDERNQAVFAFDEEGHCIWKIRTRGGSPKEYTQLTGFDVDEDSRKIYLFSRREKILVYDFDANFLEEYKVRFDGTSIGVMNDRMYLYAYNRTNRNNGEKLKNNLLIINKGKIQQAYLPFEKESGTAFTFNSPNAFYRYNDEMRLYMPFSTKIYSHKGENLTVRYFFDFGRNNIPKALLEEDNFQDLLEDTNYAYGLNTYWENRNYCSFRISFEKGSTRILFDKRTKEIKYGLYDDLAYCFPNIQQATDDHATGFRDAMDLLYEAEHSNARKEKSLLKEVVKSISEDSNPVVFIYYFKKSDGE